MVKKDMKEMALKFGMIKPEDSSAKEAPKATTTEPEKPRKRGSYFKTTPKKDAMITISTTSAVKDFIDEVCIAERKTRSTLITEIIEAHMEASKENC